MSEISTPWRRRAARRRGAAQFRARLDRLMARWQRGGVENYSLESTLAHGLRRLAGRAAGRFEVTEHHIWITGLPETFRGLRIVHLTDIHHGLFLPLQDVIDAARLVNELNPDVVAVTGDFVTYSRAYIEPVAEVLGSIRARYGVYAVLGNHDFRVGADEIARRLRRHKLRVLRNRHTRIRRDGQVLYVAGVDDLRYRADLSRALQRVPAGAPTILLSHNPGIIRSAAHRGVSLVLSGHTHGGQVNLPLVGSIYGRSPERLRFKMGWDRLGRTQIYVSRGLGTVVLPLRLRCPAEIPVFTLQPHSNGPVSIRRPRG